MQTYLRRISGITHHTGYIPATHPGYFSVHLRNFASSARMSYKYEYLVQIPDKPNALQQRLAVRPKHLEELKPKIARDQIVFGGARLSEQPKEGETPPMIGSVLLIKADSEEEVWKLLREDPYTKGGAWDVDKAVITPFKCAIRTAM